MTDIGCGRELFDGLCKRVEVVPQQRTEHSNGLVARLADTDVQVIGAYERGGLIREVRLAGEPISIAVPHIFGFHR